MPPFEVVDQDAQVVRFEDFIGCGRKSYFTPEGKVALMFLKMKTQMSFPKLMEALNGKIFYQMFCDIVIDPARPLLVLV